MNTIFTYQTALTTINNTIQNPFIAIGYILVTTDILTTFYNSSSTI